MDQAMSAATQFVCELIRAANVVEKVDDIERQRLLNRSVVTIRDMRERAGSMKSRPIKQAINDLQSLIVAVHCGHAHDEQIHSGLLHAATIIRKLHIVLDAKADMQVVA